MAWFFLADGHITNRGEITFTLAYKDKDHLEKIANLANGKIRILKKNKTENGYIRQHVRFSTMDKDTCNKIKQILGLTSSRKTNFPPNIKNLEDISIQNLDALFIGFFDGDGCLRKKGYGTIGCNIAWLPVFYFFEQKGLVSNARNYGNNAYCTVPVKVMKRLKNVDVPKMERKWR